MEEEQEAYYERFAEDIFVERALIGGQIIGMLALELVISIGARTIACSKVGSTLAHTRCTQRRRGARAGSKPVWRKWLSRT